VKKCEIWPRLQHHGFEPPESKMPPEKNGFELPENATKYLNSESNLLRSKNRPIFFQRLVPASLKKLDSENVPNCQ